MLLHLDIDESLIEQLSYRIIATLNLATKIKHFTRTEFSNKLGANKRLLKATPVAW